MIPVPKRTSEFSLDNLDVIMGELITDLHVKTLTLYPSVFTLDEYTKISGPC